MSQNLIDTIDSKTSLLILIKQPQNKVLSIIRHRNFVSLRIGEIYLGLLDEVVHLMLVTVEERRNTHNHLINQNT